MYSRRDFAKIAAGTVPVARSLWAVNSTIHGVRMAVQSASFTFSGSNFAAGASITVTAVALFFIALPFKTWFEARHV